MELKPLDYIDFLKAKICSAPITGLDIDPSEVHPALKPHQRDSVVWAIRGGKRALFESFGLGKTLMQLEILRLILKYKGGKGLIVCPLGVRGEFIRDGREILGVEVQYIRNMAEAQAATADILITNYERVRDGDLDPKWFTVTSLDEAGVLRSYGSKTYQEFLPKFSGVPFKFVATATPSPNRYKELIHYAGYLEIMDTGQALTRFFKRDSTKANNLTLYEARAEEFWLWMSTWALFVSKPSDLNAEYSDQGYDLPPMEVIYHQVGVDHASAGSERDGQGKMFRDAAFGLSAAATEKRDSIGERVAELAKIVSEEKDDGQWVIWCDLNREQEAIEAALKDRGISVTSLYGAQDIEERETKLLDWKGKRTRVFLSKPQMYGSGVNLQQAHKMIFAGIGYEFADFIQSIHRIWRYLQANPVEIHIIYTESEQSVLDVLKDKWAQHNVLVEKMTSLIREYGLASVNVIEKLARTIREYREEIKGQRFTAILNDNVMEMPRIADNSIDLIVTSIPFSVLYEYSATYNDFGHNENGAKFFEQMDYLTPHLLRVLKPGRVAAIHVKDRVEFGSKTGDGMPTIDPFHADCIAHYRKHGFRYFGMITILTDVVRENNQTYRLGWTEQCKDGTKMGVGCPEYILLLRKLPSSTIKAYADVPVVKTKEEYTRARWQIDAHGFWRSSGDRLISMEELRKTPVPKLQAAYREFSRKTVYDYKEHVELSEHLDREGSLPATFAVVAPGSWDDDIWDDVNRMLTLNTQQSLKGQEMHLCPLQTDTVERLINRFSNPGEVVFDPFMGLGTVPYIAMKTGRRGHGIELSEVYFGDALGYLKAMDQEKSVLTLFDLLEEGA